MVSTARDEECDPPGEAGTCPRSAVCGADCRCPCSAGAGGRCGTSNAGACRFGMLECRVGALVCVGNVEPVPEVCGDGIDQNCDGSDLPCALAVAITTPVNLTLTNHSPAALVGTASSSVTSVTCNGVAATLAGGAFTATVPLGEGSNVITCVVGDATGHVVSASVDVTLDATPPRVVVGSPRDGAMITASPVVVTGMINDVVVGTVNGAQATVTVNGIEAQVANRNFLADGVALTPGPNTITAVGRDRAGNTASARVTVDYEPVVAQPALTLVSGNQQRGTIGSLLPDPLVVALADGDGAAVAGETVVFRVVENGTLGDGPRSARVLAVQTDAQGRAQVRWTLGTRAGAGNNVVQTSAMGFAGTAMFIATTLPAPPDRISVDDGNNQTGTTGQPLPRPFVVVVTDAGHNRLAGVPVTFRVVEGSGSIGGQVSVEVDSDGDGRAAAVLALGAEEGIENDVVEATFNGNSGAPATFVASAMTPGDPAATSLAGVVLDNTNLPVPGVSVGIVGTNLLAQTDAQGEFVLRPAPVGHVHLVVNGSTATRPGSWPTLSFDLVTVSGHDNRLPMPVYLLPLDLPHGLQVDETHGGTMTIPEVPGFSLTVAPGSVTFPDGTKRGLVSVTLVHADKVPMTPNGGAQPRLVVTIQPPGARFDPPAPITYPNTDGLGPGEVIDLVSFDHDLGQFVSDGPGTVSEDGTVVRSNPGVGITKGGWHDPAMPSPSGKAQHSCDDGNDCTIDSRDGNGQCQHTETNSAPCRTSDGVDSCGGVCVSTGGGPVCYPTTACTDCAPCQACQSCRRGTCAVDESRVPYDDPCGHFTCTGSHVRFVVDPDDVPPDDHPGDCHRPACGSDGNTTSEIDRGDVPSDAEKGDCHKPACNADGVVVQDLDLSDDNAKAFQQGCLYPQCGDDGYAHGVVRDDGAPCSDKVNLEPECAAPNSGTCMGQECIGAQPVADGAACTPLGDSQCVKPKSGSCLSGHCRGGVFSDGKTCRNTVNCTSDAQCLGDHCANGDTSYCASGQTCGTGGHCE